MSHLIALVFDDQFKGEEARAALHRMASEGLLEMNDTVFARKPDGKTSVSQEDNVMARVQKKMYEKNPHRCDSVRVALFNSRPKNYFGTCVPSCTCRKDLSLAGTFQTVSGFFDRSGLSFFTFGVMLWAVCGLLLGRWPLLLANVATVALCLAILSLKLHYR
jgi:hypothetical protein